MRRTSRSFFTCCLAIALGFGVACGKKPDDAKISSEIQGKFSQDSGLSGKQLTVQSNNGVVTLGGTVDNEAQREAASRQAASVAGVREVVNNLQAGNASAAASLAVAPPVARRTSGTVGPDRAAGSGRKSRKARASEDSGQARNSENDSNASANLEQPSIPEADPPTPSPTSPPPPDHAAVVETPPPPPEPAAKKLILDQGTELAIRLIDPIDSEKNHTGDTFHATLNAALNSDGEQAVPAGAELIGHLAEVKSAGKFAGQSDLVLQLDSLSFAGKTYGLETDQYRKTGSSRGKNTAEKVGGGAIVGGIIGALAAGGKGAAIGTAAGAGVGGGAQAASKSPPIKLPAETVLNFTLQAPITVVQATSPNANRPKLGDTPQ
jgi:hypothetical protein